MMASGIQLVIFDWAGTTIDFGSLAPVRAFVELFRREDVAVTTAQARVPMGMHKKDHIREMLRISDVAARWQAAKGSPWTEADVDRLYHAVAPIQLDTIRQSAELVPGLLPVIENLRQSGLKIGGTTGYFVAAAQLVLEQAKTQGFIPDCSVNGDEVPKGRPAPWMVYRVMQQLNVYPPSAVLKVGDTLLDIEEGLNAGVWSVGVCDSSSECGYSLDEWQQLTGSQRDAAIAHAREKFLAAKAHAVIDSIHELPALVKSINERIARGEKP
ncbi:phosphonoacetaldehyde hydrolase [Planctopirus hydrillae]|uniref:phosphonoacetaldehyde hydrolase n=2 Tax=Planctopirus hydrillae TaxID=1841610 RepID=A0A1C3EK07_9PLAN|nr:phosphonoacetaldehyde hydrolase [Planctopirus hydrillae]